jgi:hypothetical protein
MDLTVKTSIGRSQTAVSVDFSFQRFSIKRFSSTQTPLFPRSPHFPAFRSDPMALSTAFTGKAIS